MFQKLADFLLFTTQDFRTICNTCTFYLSCKLCAIWYKLHQIKSARISCKCRKYAAVRNLLLEWFHKIRLIHQYWYLILLWFQTYRDTWSIGNLILDNISNRCLSIKVFVIKWTLIFGGLLIICTQSCIFYDFVATLKSLFSHMQQVSKNVW